MSDTASYSDLMFGLLWCLGYKFSLRLAEMKETRFWRIDPAANYGPSQLNRGEGRHSVARHVFHGQRGELHQRYRQGQEDQLGTLELVVNMIVLWNTWYIQDVLDELRDSGQEVRPEDVERLAPLRFQHINVHGNYHFVLPESVAQGNHRPLRSLASSSEEIF